MLPADLHPTLEIFGRVLIACLLGALIGWERERHGTNRSAGIRTYGAIALGACVFGVLSISVPGYGADPSRVAAQIVSGVGFLGGGVIFRKENSVSGLTTAATLWATAAVGLAVAFGFYLVSFLTSLLIYLMLYLPRLAWWRRVTGK
ncbi:MAG: MgtC/SapB family protein [Gammaproteobacteria bacterium]|nr:MgtC/SapB family protein [Gammaproteobacteria bacterium]